MYPSRSEFTSDEPHSAWWLARIGHDTMLCSSTGAAFVRTLQRTLQVPVSGSWDDATLQALAAQGAPGIRSQVVTHSAILAGVWVLHRSARGPLPGQLKLTDVRVPYNAVLPRYETVIPSDGQIGISCESLVDERGEFISWPEPQSEWLLGGLAVIALAVAYSWRE